MAKKSVALVPSVPSVQPRLLRVEEAASYLGATVWFVRTLAWEKKVRAVKLGSRLLFPREELDRYVDHLKAEAGA